MSGSAHWIWYGSGALLGAIALALAGWAIFWDRSRGRLRCPKCWYSMEGAAASGEDTSAPTWSCPECGRRVTRQSQLRRTRRRPRALLVAVTIAVCAALIAGAPAVRRRGWFWLIPTRVLVEALPLSGGDGAFADELARRMGALPWPDGSWDPAFSLPQHLSLLRRIGSGNVLARPMSATWKGSYGEFFLLHGSAIAGVDGSRSDLSIEPLRAEFERVFGQMRALPHEVRMSPTTPAPRGGRLTVTPEVLEWWPHGFAELRLLYRSSDGWIEAEPASGGAFTFSLPDAEAPEIECEVHVVRRTYYEPAARAAVPVGAQRFTLSVPTVPRMISSDPP